MSMAFLSFTRVVLFLFACLLSYYAYSMYLIFNPAQCTSKSRGSCLRPVYPSHLPLELWVYVSEKQLVQKEKMELLWREKSLLRNSSVTKDVNVTLPISTLKNGSLYAHVFLTLPGRNPLLASDRPYMSVFVVSLTRYAVPKDTTFNLLGGGSVENSSGGGNKSSVRPVTHWVPWLDMHSVDYDYLFHRSQVPAEILPTLKFFPGTPEYLPILYVDRLKIMENKLQQVFPDNSSLPLRLSFSPVSIGQLRLWLSFHHSLSSLRQLGFTEKEFDDVKGIFLDTNLPLLLLTVFISLFHLLFDFLAFKNEISFWRGRRSMVGLSTRTIVWRCFSQSVVFLYLMEEKTSLLVIIPAGIAALIEFWKVTKALKIKIVFRGCLPLIQFGTRGKAEAESEGYDGEAMRYLSYLLYPLVLAGAVYQLMYTSFTSWYSWIIHSLVNGVYAFGFLFMLPQLFLNYKLKSVAHLPWKAFMYKAFNTFIDDVFAFIIVMPTSHRIAVFRDDLVFLVYLYQRWLYPVDRTRVNEYGESFDSDTKQKKE